MSECLFCNLASNEEDFIYENQDFFSLPDKFPVTKGHTLVIAKQHCKDFFDFPKEKAGPMVEAVQETKSILEEKYSPDAFNVGANNGKDAGQTIFHFHLHLIPRYKGDNPWKNTQMP